MKVIDIFSGIGGFSIAAQWIGWETLVTCEIDEFCRKVLQYHFPDAYHHDDIKTLTYKTIEYELSKRYGRQWRNDDIIIAGGFPCTPFSITGLRKGTQDDRHLWPQMLRVIRDVQPEWVVAENVSGLLTQERGVVFESVCTDLEAEGYAVQPLIIPACAVDAPHRRDRIFIVANRADTRIESMQRGGENGVCGSETPAYADSILQREWNEYHIGKTRQKYVAESFNGAITASNTSSIRRIQNNKGEQPDQPEQIIPDWRNFPTQSPVCSRNDEFSARLADITFSRWRRESIKALGNAVVPVLAYQIFKTIDETK